MIHFKKLQHSYQLIFYLGHIILYSSLDGVIHIFPFPLFVWFQIWHTLSYCTFFITNFFSKCSSVELLSPNHTLLVPGVSTRNFIRLNMSNSYWHRILNIIATLLLLNLPSSLYTNSYWYPWKNTSSSDSFALCYNWSIGFLWLLYTLTTRIPALINVIVNLIFTILWCICLITSSV